MRIFSINYLSPDLPDVRDMDLAFVISASSPSASVNFAKIKEIVKEVIDLYGVQRVYYSVILFGRDPTVRIKFTEQFTEDALKNTIGLLPRPTDGASLHTALENSREVFTEGSRPDSKKVVVVVVDQKSESGIDDVRNAAGKLEEDGIKVIPVAFGSLADPDETTAITTNKQNVVRANETSDPKDIAKEISMKIAEGKKQRLYTNV